MRDSHTSAPVLRGLKDFQRRTVDFAYARMFASENPALRFLVADEVGLGKTLVAKGLIARAIDTLRLAGQQRIDVVYVCSNADIAAQNLERLQQDGHAVKNTATRLTLLPLQRDRLGKDVNFISLTPGTTFNEGNRSGHKEERHLIYQMLHTVDGIDDRGLLRALRGSAREGWEDYASRELDFDEAIARVYRKAVSKDKGLMAALKAVTDVYRDGRRTITDAVHEDCLDLIVRLRRLLAHTCLGMLKPGLVILDEFQRFGELLDDDTEGSAGELARGLFNHASAPRVLLLSATPYKMYATADDQEDHYQDFLRTLGFLLEDQPEAIAQLTLDLRQFRDGLLDMRGESDLAPLSAVKLRIETTLKRVMCRTERVGNTVRADAMVSERLLSPRLEPRDLDDFRLLDTVAGKLGEPDTVEYWKSSPYLLNFMGDYTFKTAIRNDLKKRKPLLAELLFNARKKMLSASAISAYAPIDPANARLRLLMGEIGDQGLHRLLWMPPSLPYWAPGGAYAQAGQVSKQLIFSAWNVVPDALASLLSYEVERRIVADAGGDKIDYDRLRQRFTPRLRLDMRNGRPGGMTNLMLMYPSSALVALVDPLHWTGTADGLPTVAEVKRKAMACLEPYVEACIERTVPDGAEDRRWYWVTLARLEARHAGAGRAWCENGWQTAQSLVYVEEQDEPEHGNAFDAHRDAWLAAWDGKLEGLGRVPADLLEVIAELALAGPATCALRTLVRQEPALAADLLQGPAARIAAGLRSQLNAPTAIALLHDLEDDDAHWRRVLHYCIDGNLQALLDEYVHLLAEAPFVPKQDDPPAAKMLKLAATMVDAMTLRSATIRPDELTVTDGKPAITQSTIAIRTHFAVRFGGRTEEDSGASRKTSVKQAFNSPFWPFILVSTSVGQEGLDFHPWCHAVTHWNLPSNPVDLEQREGRVHRYKGYAVRKNVALAHGAAVRADASVDGDAWQAMFARAVANRRADANDLIPYWIYEVDGGAAVERRVMALPLSRDELRYRNLKRSLALYRMVFAQPRQEDLLACLEQNIGADRAADVAARWRIDLAPDQV
jgi:hypothetical protein